MSVLFRKSYKYLGILSVVALAFVVWAQTRSTDTDIVGETASPLSPVAWWLFFETSGNVLEDAMGNGHEGIILDADAVIRFTSSLRAERGNPDDDIVPGSALRIIGNAGKELISIPELHDFPFESGFTATAWIRTGSSPSEEGAPDLTPPSPSRRGVPEGRGGFPEGEWFHLALTSDGNASAIYVNSSSIDITPLTTDHLPLTTILSDLLPFTIDHSSFTIVGDAVADLDIADVRLYDAPLAQPEIEALFLESAEFIESLASVNPESAAVAALRALQGDSDSLDTDDRSPMTDPPTRGPILSPNATPVPANILFRILTPMEN